MHFRDDGNRAGKQNNDIDGCTAHDVVEVDNGHDLIEPSCFDDRGRDLFVALSGKSPLEDTVRPSRPIHGRNASARYEATPQNVYTASLGSNAGHPSKLVSRG